jgi:oligopeptidase B
LFIHIRRSESALRTISVDDHDSSECHLLDLPMAPQHPPRRASRAGLRYDVEHRGDRLFIRTNADGAEDFKTASAPLASPGRPFWIDEVPTGAVHDHQSGGLSDYLLRTSAKQACRES